MEIFELSALVTRLRAMTQLTSRLFDGNPFNSEASKQGGTDYIITVSFFIQLGIHSSAVLESKEIRDSSRNLTKTVI